MAQLAEADGLKPFQCRFESDWGHNFGAVRPKPSRVACDRCCSYVHWTSNPFGMTARVHSWTRLPPDRAAFSCPGSLISAARPSFGRRCLLAD